MTQVMALRIPCVRGYEMIAMHAVAEAARLREVPADRVDDLRTAVAEACLNAMEHGNAMDDTTTIEVRVTATDDEFAVEVTDLARGLPPPPNVAPPAVEKWGVGGPAPRGMGLFVISRLMDHAEFTTRTPDGDTVFRMVARLGDARGEG